MTEQSKPEILAHCGISIGAPPKPEDGEPQPGTSATGVVVAIGRN